jgi:hypothetical protein
VDKFNKPYDRLMAALEAKRVAAPAETADHRARAAA